MVSSREDLPSAAPRGFRVLPLSPLSSLEVAQCVSRVCSSHRKALAPRQAQAIRECPRCRDPAFLRVLLADLMHHGLFETLTEKVQQLAACSSLPDLFASGVSL